MIAVDVVQAAAEHFHLTAAMLKSTKKDARIVWARMVASYVLRRELHLSSPMASAAFGQDHSTALHAEKRVASVMLGDDARAEETRAAVAAILARARELATEREAARHAGEVVCPICGGKGRVRMVPVKIA